MHLELMVWPADDPVDHIPGSGARGAAPACPPHPPRSGGSLRQEYTEQGVSTNINEQTG